MKSFDFLSPVNALTFCIQVIFLKESNADWFDHKITVMISQNEPFLFFGNQTNIGIPKGVDISILDTFARKFDMQIEYLQTNESLREVFASEEKSKQLLKNSLQTNIDIFAGGLEENFITRKYLVASQYYHHNYITWCVAKRKMLPRWLHIFRFCSDPSLWLVFSIQAVCILLAAYFFQLFEKTKWDWNKIFVHGIACYSGMSCGYKPQNNANRVLFAGVLLGCLIYVTSFTAYFMDWVTKIFYVKQVSSIQEIVSGGFILAGEQYTFLKLLQQNETYAPEMLHKFRYCNDLNVCLNQLKWNQNLAVAISHERIKSNLLLTVAQIYCFDKMESIHKYPLRFLIKENFRYLNQLNKFIQMASSSGLSSHWLDMNRIKSHFLYEEKVHAEFNLLGVYVVFSMLLLFTTVIYFVELIKGLHVK